VIVEKVKVSTGPAQGYDAETMAYVDMLQADHSITRSARSRSDWGSSFLLSGQHPGKST
jgi:hypothetical protein